MGESQKRFRRASKSVEPTAEGRRAESEPGGGSSSGGGGGDSGSTKSHGKRGGGGGRGGSGGRVGDGCGESVGLKRVSRPPVNTLRLDVPELSSDLDSRQVRTRQDRKGLGEIA